MRTKQENTEYMRKYRNENREYFRNYNRKYNKRWRKENGYHNETNWRVKNPIKHKTQLKLQAAVKGGKIKRLPCEVCQSPKSQAHHPNYKKPLKVNWLCALHHKELHNSSFPKLYLFFKK